MSGNSSIPESLWVFFEEHPKPALAFSGGADSSYLLYAAVECGADVTAYFVKSQFQPIFELENAKKTAEELGVELHVILHNALSDGRIAANTAERCYLCKKNIFEKILRKAQEDKKKCVIDATNASDDCSDRPGMKALEELGILSPLRTCGISKSMVREYSRNANLWTWNLPSNSCLATRVRSGTTLSDDILLKVEECEDRLRELGFTDIRVRTDGSSAKLETIESESKLLETSKQEVEKLLSEYFSAAEYGTREPRP